MKQYFLQIYMHFITSLLKSMPIHRITSHHTCKKDATGAAGLNSVKSSKQLTSVPKNFFLCSSGSSIKKSIEKIPFPIGVRQFFNSNYLSMQINLTLKKLWGGEESRRGLLRSSPCSEGQSYDYKTLLYLSIFMSKITFKFQIIAFFSKIL